MVVAGSERSERRALARSQRPPSRMAFVLATAAEVRAAAVDEDLDALHQALARLHGLLLEHIRQGREEVDALPGALPQVVHDGQRRLVALVDDLLFAAEDEGGTCSCLVRSAELEHRALRLARLEETARETARQGL